jgi:hypothetical protein
MAAKWHLRVELAGSAANDVIPTMATDTPGLSAILEIRENAPIVFANGVFSLELRRRSVF